MDNYMTKRACGCFEISLGQGRAILPCTFHEPLLVEILDRQKCICFDARRYRLIGRTGAGELLDLCPIHKKGQQVTDE